MSSTRRYLKAYSLFTNEAMSTSLTSASTNIAYADQVSIQITSDNTDAVGQWSVEGSVDKETFIPMTFDNQIQATTSGNDDAILIDMKLISFAYIRVKYTRTSGSGTATVKISTKGL